MLHSCYNFFTRHTKIGRLYNFSKKLVLYIRHSLDLCSVCTHVITRSFSHVRCLSICGQVISCWIEMHCCRLLSYIVLHTSYISFAPLSFNHIKFMIRADNQEGLNAFENYNSISEQIITKSCLYEPCYSQFTCVCVLSRRRIIPFCKSYILHSAFAQTEEVFNCDCS